MISLLLGIALVAVWTSVSRLKEQVGVMEAALVDGRELREAVDQLKRRVADLELARTQAVVGPAVAAFPGAAPAAAPAKAPSPIAPPTPPGRTEAVAPPAAPPAVVAAPSLPPPPRAVREPERVVATPSPTLVTEPDAQPSEGWEVVVGTSWLNKIGILIFVTGLALLLGYSMTHVGPLGRVVMGIAMGAAMLTAGVVLERRAPYKAYGLGLVAGGWAGLYVTAFAMRAIPAAQVVENDAVAVLLLLAVAGGMIAHSLRYRSQTVTALAYVSAYVPLGFTPLATFSLVATIPLAVSLIVVSSRFSWSNISLLGLASTYGLLALRGHVLPGVAPDGTAITPYLLLASYWLTFEIADIAAHRVTRSGDTPRPVPLFVTNTVGYLGSLSLLLPVDAPDISTLALSISAAGYLASAAIRRRLLPPSTLVDDDAGVFTTVHGAIALAAALSAGSIGLHFDGPRATVMLLLEAELVIAASLALSDRHIRRIGTALAGLVTVHALTSAWIDDAAALTWPWPMSAWTPTLALVAAAWYFNREWLRRRQVSVDPVEHLYTWIASFAVGLILAHEVAPIYRGLAGLVLATVLLQFGTRRAREYRYQAHVALAAGVSSVFAMTVLEPIAPSAREVWAVLPLATLLAYGFAWWMHRPGSTTSDDERDLATTFAGCAGTTLLAILEWRTVSPSLIGPVLSATAAALVGIGAWRQSVGLRGQGYVLIALGAARALLPLLSAAPGGWVETGGIVLVIALLYTTTYVGRRAAAGDTTSSSDLEQAFAGPLALAATSALALLTWRVLPAQAVAPAWALTAVILVSLGQWRRTAGQRWQAYAIAAAAIIQSMRLLEWPKGGGLSLDTGWLTTATAGSVAFAGLYLVTYLGRTPGPGNQADRSTDLERHALVALTAFVTIGMLHLQRWLVIEPAVPVAWSATAGALLAAGFVSRAVDLRAQAYVVFAMGALRALSILERGSDRADTIWTIATIALLYAASFASRQSLRQLERPNERHARIESVARVGLSAAATGLLTLLIAVKAPNNLVTAGWGLEGTGLLLLGFARRERALRLAGLGLLLLCVLKLFIYDLRELEALGRIISFVVLGLVLLGVSWVYTRYKEQIRRLL